MRSRKRKRRNEMMRRVSRRRKRKGREEKAMELILASAKSYHMPSEKLPPGMSLEDVKKAMGSGTEDGYLVKKGMPTITVGNSPAAA